MCTWIAETCITTRNKHNLSSWVSPTNIAKVYLTTTKPKLLTLQMQQTNENWHCLLSHLVHSSQLYSSVSEFSSLKVSGMCEQWLTANRTRVLNTDHWISRMHLSLFFYSSVHDRYSTFLLLGVSSPWLSLVVSLTRHFPLLAITQRFLYSTYPMKGITCIFTQTFHYLTFQLLDVSALPCVSVL